MTLAPVSAVFSMASITVNRLKVYAWQPIAKPPVLYSSGIFSANMVSDTSMGVRATQKVRAIRFIDVSGFFWMGQIASSKRGGVKAKSAAAHDPERGAPAPPRIDAPCRCQAGLRRSVPLGPRSVPLRSGSAPTRRNGLFEGALARL